MDEMDHAIKIMKAAMEKERAMKENSKESMDGKIDLNEELAPENDEIMDEATASEEMEDVSGEEGMEEKATGEKDSKSGKSIFKSSKNKELAAKDQKIEELTDRLMRTMAEFDNFRKRSEKEKAQMYDIGAKSIIEKVLPVVDNFERGLGTLTDSDKENAFAQGIEKVYKQLTTSLEEAGVKPIEAVGNEFDPNLHNAVMHGEDDNLGANIVSDEFQKGYMYRDSVVRHSMVKVVN
ncbi:MAG: hypothetical protein K0S47_865 [Herbinix sp.]|nr:hypothetical protein [Herbinix sp.]